MERTAGQVGVQHGEAQVYHSLVYISYEYLYCVAPPVDVAVHFVGCTWTHVVLSSFLLIRFLCTWTRCPLFVPIT